MTTGRQALTFRRSERVPLRVPWISADEHAAEVVFWPALTRALIDSTSAPGTLSIGFEQLVPTDFVEKRDGSASSAVQGSVREMVGLS
jgi:hypothetical protein